MPKINVYLPDELAAAVRDAGIPVSAVCQRALADAVAAADGRAASGAESTPRSEGWQPHRFTDRARKVIALATEAAGGAQDQVSSPDVLGALIRHGNNLALAIMRSMEIEPDDVLSELTATVATAAQAGTPEPATLLQIAERASAESAALSNDYVGCEHLLLGILAGPDGDPAVRTLTTMGLTREKARDAVRVALGGYSFAQNNLTLAGLSAPVRMVLEEIRQRLSKIETGG
ncbi:MAG TPA: Clp protease N-terminal domain-containing protein [Jatrophihabitans sp.]|nr:Clp protease N-terminal domain-containing protein [Jatrophihabitans sp.]